MSPRFRPLLAEELPTLLSWAAAEGWNPGLHDAGAFLAADPEGFHALEVGGELVGGASTVVYEERLGFVGLFIVRPEWRGRGFGVAFWHHFISQMRERIGPKGGAALDGVFTMQEKYAQSGFTFSHRNLRMEGRGPSAPVGGDLIPASAVSEEELIAFDRAHFGAARLAFLRHWLAAPGSLALVAPGESGLEGYGVARPCGVGMKIGPLFATRPEVAERLFTHLAAHAGGGPFWLDTPENNPHAMALAARHSLREVFGCARMTLGHPPALPWGQIYGVTSFELG